MMERIMETSNMEFTKDGPIIRCRNCKKSRKRGWKCTRFIEELYDSELEIGELTMANVRPDGFCAWGIVGNDGR